MIEMLHRLSKFIIISKQYLAQQLNNYYSSNFISMIHIIPFILCFFTTFSKVFQIHQPTLLTWIFQNKTHTLFIYNIKAQSILVSQKIVQYPADYKKDQMIVAASIQNVTVYRPKIVNHQITIQYIYYTGFNQTVQGALTANAYQQPNTQPHQPINEQFSSENLLSLRAYFDKKSMDYFSKIYLKTDYDFYTYELPSSLFSPETECSSVSVFSGQSLRKMPEGCFIITAKDVVQMNIYSNKYIVDHKQKKADMQIVFLGAGVSGIFYFNHLLQSEGIKTLPLSSFSNNLSKLSLTTKSSSSNKSTLNISITNTGSYLVYFQITCYQGNETIFAYKILLQPNDSKDIVANLSSFLPASDITFKIVNPISGQFNEIKLANFYQKKLQPTSSIIDFPSSSAQIKQSYSIQTPVYIIVLAAIGGFFGILFISTGIWVILRKAKSNSEPAPTAKSNAFSEAENIKTSNTADPSERMEGNRVYLSTNDIVAFQQCEVIQTKKQGTSTTLDSENRQIKNSEQQIDDHVSIEDNLEIREQIGIKMQTSMQMDSQPIKQQVKFHKISASTTSIQLNGLYHLQSGQNIIEYPDQRLDNVEI